MDISEKSLRQIGRYERRKAKREQKKLERNLEVGTVEDAFAFHDMFYYGKKCCNGVRWKNSVQQFELHLLSRTAKNYKAVQTGTWKPKEYIHFTLCERGKQREIDAPHINDRQIHKTLTQNVLIPIYTSYNIYDNGASQKGKGLDFAYKRLKQQMCWFYKKYGNNGYVVKLDLKDFFPSAPRTLVYDKHHNLILNSDIKDIADKIIDSFPGDNGLVLGVEPSQLEMVSLLSDIDNYIKCQLGIHCAIHYMDDYILIVRTKEEAQRILVDLTERFTNLGFTINSSKSYIQPLHKPFRFCKSKFHFSKTGKIIINRYKDSIKRNRRKLKIFKQMVDKTDKSVKEVKEWLITVKSYYERFNDHNRVLKLNRIYYTLFVQKMYKGVII